MTHTRSAVIRGLAAAMLWSFSISAFSAAAKEEADGKQLMTEACTQCHGLRPIVVTRDGAPGWRDTVEKMVVIGAQLNRAEIDRIVDYLAKQYGPSAGPMKTGPLPANSALKLPAGETSADIVLPAGKGKQLVQVYCHMCHDLGRVVIDRRSEADWRRYTQNMLAQGGLSVGAKEVTSMVNYLTEHFGSDRK